MNIKTISFGHTKNLGNYQSDRLDVTVELAEGEDAIEKTRELKQFVYDRLNEKVEKLDAAESEVF